MPEKRIVILGAGLAGLSAAWSLQKRGVDCLVLEKEPEAGGLCRSKNIDGFSFDRSGHLLHFKHRESLGLIKKLLGDNIKEHERSAWVHAYGRYMPYPFQANLHGLPPEISKECILGFISASGNKRLKSNKNSNFLSWINKTFGPGIAKHFMIPYNQKFWTMHPRHLTSEWLDGFIPVPSLEQVIEGTVEESKRQFGYNAKFWYPIKGGINSLVSAFSGSLKNIHTNSSVEEIDLNRKEIRMSSGAKEKYDLLISSVPLPELSHLLCGAPKGLKPLLLKLKWNSIFNLNLGVNKHDLNLRHWIYFPQDDVCFFRVGFYHNFAPVRSSKFSLYAEVAYPQGSNINKNHIIPLIENDLIKIGILEEKDKICVKDANVIKYGYPVYDKHYKLTREKIIELLGRNKVFLCGRYGSWRYFSMEDTMLDGMNLARSVCKYV